MSDASKQPDQFEGLHNEIAVYQFSALLDAETCSICISLDGSVVNYEDFVATKWNPPLHASCRCIWVGINKDQTEIPKVTGFPAIGRT